ncbi:H-NS histone family protein [Luteimonas sp. 50]|uniref:H-NS histone family protein n=1 Tax=Cognatiluteimonas sedimenti TaxID=2927791 RepID=A0ABT0A6Q0_9GAMM|nr:H-NS histone family protein [Lysobacter sedimenti]MCJ0826668.1 H-NS histone family protein [Lysobacter sedimenti]
MSIDLSKLSTRELDALIAKAKKRKATLGKRKPIATVRGKLTQLAKAEGYTIAELFGTRDVAATPRAKPAKAGRKLGKVAPKYRNPDNAAQTWSGRGMQPKWLAEQVRRGRSPADFLISATLTAKPIKQGKQVVKAAQDA